MYAVANLGASALSDVDPLVRSFEYSVGDDMWRAKIYKEVGGGSVLFSVNHGLIPPKDYSIVVEYGDVSEDVLMHFLTTLWEDSPIAL